MGRVSISAKTSVIVSVFLLTVSCIALVGPASAPENVKATQGTKEDRVILTWDEVKRAGVYAVYRSSSENGDYEYLASTDGTSYVDVAVAALVRYWYIVAAADYLGRAESEKPAAPVEGWCIHTFSWQSSTLTFDGSQFDIVANPAAIGEAFAVWCGATQSAVNAEVYREGEWRALSDPFGITTGDVAGSVSIATAGGVPYIAYRDEASGGELAAVYLDESGEEPEWKTLGSAGPGISPIRGLESAFAGSDFYVAGLYDTVAEGEPAPVVVFLFSNDTGWQNVSPDAPAVSASSLSLAGGDADPFLAYYDETATAVVVLQHDGGWTDTGFFLDYGAANVPDGYLDLCFDETTGELVLAFYDSTAGALKVWAYDTSAGEWSGVVDPPVTAHPDAGTVGISSDQGVRYLYYKDSVSNRGTVTRFQDSSWETLPLSDETEGITGQLNLAELAIDARQYIVFAFAREGNSINADVYR